MRLVTDGGINDTTSTLGYVGVVLGGLGWVGAPLTLGVRQTRRWGWVGPSELSQFVGCECVRQIISKSKHNALSGIMCRY